MNKLLPLLLASMFLISGCGGGSNTATPPLSGAKMGGDFALTDQDGKPASAASFAGKYRIVYFGYAFCPDICPVDAQVIGRGLTLFEKQDAERGRKVVPIFITVDPGRDTPKVLKEFVANFHPRFVGLSGDATETERVANAYGVVFQLGEKSPGGGYLVDHSRTTVLYGPDGAPIAMLPTQSGPEAVAATLDQWVQ